jgi:hypothetical protein
MLLFVLYLLIIKEYFHRTHTCTKLNCDCRGNCTQNSVQCDTCQYWYHYNCKNHSMEDLEYLVKSTSSFTCLSCFREEIETPFSFTTSLQRLSLVHVCVRWKYSLIIKRYKTNNNIQFFNYIGDYIIYCISN